MKTINVKCSFCGTSFTFNVTEEQYQMYTNGSNLIQRIFPEIKPEMRELLISGTCPDCWNKMFSDFED